MSKSTGCWLVGWNLWHINPCRLFNAKSIFKQIISFEAKRSCHVANFGWHVRLWGILRHFCKKKKSASNTVIEND